MGDLPVAELLRYDQWATARLLEAVANLSDEQFAHEFAGPDSSVRQQLFHLLSVSDRYRARLMQEPVPDLKPDESQTLAQATEYQLKVRAAMDRLIDSIDPAKLDDVVQHDTRRGTFFATVQETLLHVVNHGTYHRGQIACLLKLHGVEPIDTDLVIWIKMRSTELGSKSQ